MNKGEHATVKRGNSIGNISNAGLVAIQDDWIYYSNSDDNCRLYKISVDGVYKSKLVDDSVQFINVIDEWIFYTSYKHGVDNPIEESVLCKIKIDGTSKELVDLIADFDYNFVNVLDGWLYYSNYRNNEGNIYKININDKQKVKLNTVHATTYDALTVIDNRIFFSDCVQNGVCSMDINGQNFVVYKNNILEEVMDINVISEKIYFTAIDVFTKGDNYSLYEMRLDGTNLKKALELKCGSFNFDEQFIYFQNLSEVLCYKGSLKKLY